MMSCLKDVKIKFTYLYFEVFNFWSCSICEPPTEEIIVKFVKFKLTYLHFEVIKFQSYSICEPTTEEILVKFTF